MEIGQKALEALQKQGLSDYEIKSYLSLLQNGAQTAAEVSKYSSVPYSKVYEVLGRLEQKGWVESDMSRPSKYYPKPPDVALQSNRMQRENEYRTYEEVITAELMPIYEKRGIKERPEVWIVKGEFNIIGKVNEMIDNCRTEIMIALPEEQGTFTKGANEVFQKLFGKEVKISVLLSNASTGKRLRNALPRADVRVRDGMFGGGLVSDAKQVMLLLGKSSEGSPHMAIWADHPGVAMFAKSYFESLWSSSKPVL